MLKKLSLFMLAIATHQFTVAEEIILPVGSQGQAKATLERPENGITKGQVEESFGSPVATTSAVGEPPISRWEYTDYYVYFEYDRVLHAVLKPDQNQKIK